MRVVKVAYIIFLHVLLVVVLYKSDFIEKVERMYGEHSVADEVTELYYLMLKLHSRMDENLPEGAYIFIGDSLTQGLAVSAVATPSVNYGIGSDTTEGVLRRLNIYKSLENAAVLVVAIGLNDLKFRSDEEVIANLGEIADSLPSGVPVLFSAILPVDEGVSATLEGRNLRIKNINRGIRDLVSNRRHFYYADAGPKLVDSAGNLDGLYHEGDGVHLNPQGNSIWIEVLKEALDVVEGRN